MKFVPASGAATRMFKFLRNFLDEYNVLNESINAYINRKTMSSLFLLLEWINFHFRDSSYKLKKSLLILIHLTAIIKNYYFISHCCPRTILTLLTNQKESCLFINTYKT
jgi:hypothetical protein